MKWLFTILLVLSNNVFAETNELCLQREIRKLKPITDVMTTIDKHKHCYVCCELTLRCNAVAAATAAVGKELKDLVGPGNAEWEDLRADFLGIDLAKKGRAYDTQTCLSECALYY